MQRYAKEHCSELKLTRFFLESCIFDLINTGDVSFAADIQNVVRDLRRFVPDDLELISQRKTGIDIDRRYLTARGTTTVPISLKHLMFLMFALETVLSSVS